MILRTVGSFHICFVSSFFYLMYSYMIDSLRFLHVPQCISLSKQLSCFLATFMIQSRRRKHKRSTLNFQYLSTNSVLFQYNEKRTLGRVVADSCMIFWTRTYRTNYVGFSCAHGVAPRVHADTLKLLRHAPPSRGQENKNVRLKFRTPPCFLSNPHHNFFTSEKWSSRSPVSS